MKIKSSAPGKLMLLGDHAVVYGYHCLVTAVDKRLYVEAEKIDTDTDEILTPQVKESRFVLETIAHFKKRYKISSSVRIRTRGDFSHRVGLGSSSAVTVATFQALSALFHIKVTKKEIFDMSYQVTLLIQGVGSGFDIAAATYGGTLEYVKGGSFMESLDINELPLVVGYSGVKADTPFYIRKVEEAFRSKQNDMKRIFVSMGNLVGQARESLQSKDMEGFGTCLTANHMLLQRLGVSTLKLDSMVEAALRAGAWGAKLSGAGGGDCMIALVDKKHRNQVEAAIEKVGGEIVKAAVNTRGVSVEGNL